VTRRARIGFHGIPIRDELTPVKDFDAAGSDESRP
jgi:hypothetical protein